MSWEAVNVRGTPPCGRYGHTASVVGRKIFVFGGFDGNSQLNDVHVLDQKEVNEGPFSLPLIIIPAEPLQSHLLPVLCRYAEGEVQYAWTQPHITGKAPCGRYGHTASVVGSKIYIFGGNAGTNMRLNDMHILDTGAPSSHCYTALYPPASPHLAVLVCRGI